MQKETYTCNRCGSTFEKNPDAAQCACPKCGSQDNRKSSEPVASGCGKNTRFS